MRLLVDAQCIQSSSSRRGIGRYSLALLRALVEGRGEHQVEVLLNGGDDLARLLRARAAIERFLPPQRIHVFDAPWPWDHGMRPGVRQAAELAYAAAVTSLDPDVLLVQSVFEGDRETVLSVAEVSRQLPVAAVMFDLIPAADPGTYLLGPGAHDYWRRFEDLRHAEQLLAISAYSAEVAAELLGEGCPPTTAVLGGPYPSGDFPEFESPQDDEIDLVLPERVLLTVGGDHPRKNLDRLVMAWARTPSAVRDGAALVVACGLNPGTMRRLRRLARRGGLPSGQLLLTGRLSDRRLLELYRRADGFVFASTEEGLGMPPMEAMAVGCPTVLARSSSLVELCDEPAAYFDPEDVDDIARALARLLSDPDHVRLLRSAAARSTERLTWQQTAVRAWSALEGLPRPRTEPGAAPEACRDARAPRWLDSLTTDRLEPDPEALPVAGAADGALRAALAADSVIVAPEDVSSALVAAGVLDHALVAPEALPVAVRYDPVRALRPMLARTALDLEAAGALVRAVARPPRWTLQRHRPAWLLLTSSWIAKHAALRAEAANFGVDLVVAAPGAEHLAGQADVVLVEAETVDLRLLSGARARGATVVVVGGVDADLPGWAAQQDLQGDWPGLFAAWSRTGRSTGWPWRG